MSTAGHSFIRATDGTVIVLDPETGITASGRTLAEAYAELRRLLSHRRACVDAASTPLLEGAAA